MIGGTRRQLLVALGVLGADLGLAGCAAKPSPAPARPTVHSVSPAAASVRGGTEVHLRGAGLGAVTTVQVGDMHVRVTSASADRVVFTAPATADFTDAAAKAVLHIGSTPVAVTALRFRALDGVDRQLQYVLAYWKHYNPDYQPLGSTDCVDFASQSLLVRGWRQQGTWTHADDVAQSGGAWISSTLFRDFLTGHPELGTALTDDQRAQVKLGDVVQFDWDGTGDRDHTGVVTRVSTEHGRTRVQFAGHTTDSDYRDVDDAITKDHPGGRAYYWSLR